MGFQISRTEEFHTSKVFMRTELDSHPTKGWMQYFIDANQTNRLPNVKFLHQVLQAVWVLLLTKTLAS